MINISMYINICYIFKYVRSYGQQNYAYTDKDKTIHIHIKDNQKNPDIQNIISITWSQNDSKCICCSEKSVYIYDTEKNKFETIINADGEKFLKVATHPTKNEYVCISTKKIIHFNDSITTSDASDAAKTDIDEISDMDWSYDGEYIVYCNDQGIYVYNYNEKKNKNVEISKNNQCKLQGNEYRCVLYRYISSGICRK